MWMKLRMNPILFQGRNKKEHYFEGWYFKQVSEDMKTTVCFIPGISFDGNPHSFIQAIWSKRDPESGKASLKTRYYRFPVSDFHYTDDPFSIQIAGNTFSEKGISICLQDPEYTLKGKIRFGAFTEIRKDILSPGVMGPFSYLPAMECYHGVVSMGHTLNGTISLNTDLSIFDHGKGYIEKDWGVSFPSSYLWIQTNQFKDADVSFMCSVARIPFLKASFLGFICILCIGGREYRFASYNASRLKVKSFTEEKAEILFLRNGLRLAVSARAESGALLQAPLEGSMTHLIKEGLSGILSIKLMHGKEILYKGVSKDCGIELMP